MAFSVDHVMWGVADPGMAGTYVQERWGLRAVDGGRHPRWGTAHHVIPLGPNYIDVVSVADPQEASRDPVGATVLSHLQQGGGLLTWCLATDDIDGVASRLGLEVRWKWCIRPDGSEVSWRVAGLETAMERPALPFFISWQSADHQHPGRTYTGGPQTNGITWVQVGADPAELADWLDGESVPVRCAGPPRVNAIGMAVGEDEVVLGEWLPVAQPYRTRRLTPELVLHGEKGPVGPFSAVSL